MRDLDETLEENDFPFFAIQRETKRHGVKHERAVWLLREMLAHRRR